MAMMGIDLLRMMMSVIFLWEQWIRLAPWKALAQLVAMPQEHLPSRGIQSRSYFVTVAF